MKLVRTPSKDLNNKAVIFIEADVNDGNYIRNTSTIESWGLQKPLLDTQYTLLDILLALNSSGRDWESELKELFPELRHVTEVLWDYLPDKPYDDAILDITEVSIIIYDEESKAFTVKQ